MGFSGSSYTYETATFNVTCDTSFSFVNEQAAQILYTASGLECLQACLSQFDSLSPCTAIQYDESTQGAGPDGGFECYLLWASQGIEQTPTPNVHIAQVTNQRNITVTSAIRVARLMASSKTTVNQPTNLPPITPRSITPSFKFSAITI